jgi:hypothetical protein
MIQRFQSIPPRLFTRRGFGAMVAGAAAIGPLARLGRATDPDFTLAVIPDPQYLPYGGCGAYNALMNYVGSNLNLSVDGSALNVKAVVGVGDCVNVPNDGTATTAATAWGLLDSAGIPWITPAGNHDIVGGSDLSARNIATNFQTGGFFSWDQRSGKSYFGGGYGSAGDNYYIKLTIGSWKLIVMSLEFHPRSAVMDWAKGVHDANPTYSVIVTTHSYLTSYGNQVQRGTGVTGVNDGGPDTYNQGSAPASNAGTEMWSGWFTGWSRLLMIVSGHFLWRQSYPQGWVWQQVPVTSTSSRGQTVQQIFTNQQDGDDGYDYATGGQGVTSPCDVGLESQHLFFLKFLPSVNKLRAYSVSVNTGNWIGAAGSMANASPVRLFEASLPAQPAGGLWPLPSPRRSM